MLLNKERALAVMDKYGLQAIVAARADNVLYLTDTEGHITTGLFGWPDSYYPSYFAILPRRSDIPPTYIGPNSSFGFLTDQPTWMPEVRLFGEAGRDLPDASNLDPVAARYTRMLREATSKSLPLPPQKALTECLKQLGLSGQKLGFDDVLLAQRIKEQDLPNLSYIDAYEIFREIRAVKTPEELERLKTSSDNNEVALQALFDHARPGIAWGELKSVYETTMIRKGSYPRFWGSGSGPWPYKFNLFQDKAPGMDVRLKKGDILKMDLGGVYRHYWADTGKTAVVDAPVPEWFVKAGKALRAAREEYRAILKPGTRMGDVVRAYEETVWKHGFKELRGAWGHGLGLQCYDYPSLRIHRDSQEVLEADMVINLEGGPGIIGLGGLSLENTYHITKSGFQCWSSWDGIVFQVGK